MNTANKIQALRKLLQKHKLDYYYVPSTDPHHNEYLPPCWQRRSWLTGFDGSAGDALIGLEEAYLWTDPRYFLQAEQQLDAEIFQLMRQQQGAAPPIADWLAHNAMGKRIGVDPRVMSVSQAHNWHKALTAAAGELVSIDNNLVDQIWDEQPALELFPIEIQDEKYAGKSVANKLKELRQALRELHCDAHVISMLDAIAWLFNIRGRDIDYNPLAISYAIVTADQTQLFIDPKHLDDSSTAYFQKLGITTQDYDDISEHLQALSGTVLLEPSTASWWLEQQLQQAQRYQHRSPITLMKACKNPVEINGMFEAHRRDAIAVVRFLSWLEANWQGQDELSATAKLEAFRRQDPHLKGLSFNTISAFGAHGAIVHYGVNEQTNIPISDDSIYLVDSGGQYLEGTTDITRSIHLGTPSAAERQHYTLVLKGHLALRHTQFPYGTNGEHLNAIAHHALWQQNLDFGHGTGHGVGCYLCVHEGPQRISSALTAVALEAGMIVSNEPGVYLTDQYGIRIENCVVIEELSTPQQSLTGSGPFLGFRDLTIVPYDRKLIDHTLLDHREIQWIDAYHSEIYKSLNKDLDAKDREWLAAATKPLLE